EGGELETAPAEEIVVQRRQRRRRESGGPPHDRVDDVVGEPHTGGTRERRKLLDDAAIHLPGFRRLADDTDGGACLESSTGTPARVSASRRRVPRSLTRPSSSPKTIRPRSVCAITPGAAIVLMRITTIRGA